MIVFRTFFIMLVFSFQAIAQPGPDVRFPINIKLNQYPEFPKFLSLDSMIDFTPYQDLGFISIDSTSDLSIIPQLKVETNLSLEINLPFIPSEFEQFSNTESLSLILNGDTIDISFLNAFKKLKSLLLRTDGDLYFSEYLVLDSLKELDISFSKKLTSLEAFKHLSSLNHIELRYVPQLKAFPEMDAGNQVQELRIYQESGDGCTNCPPNPNQLDLTHLNKLRQLEVLEFSNVNGLTKIPSDLSKNLRVFKIFDVQRANKKFAIRSYIDDVSGFANYEMLEVIEIAGVHIKEFKGDFQKLNLKRFIFSWVYGLEDISGIFTMNSIAYAHFVQCGFKTIEGKTGRVKIDKLIFSECTNIEKIDFLLSCEHINHLELQGGRNLRLPDPKKWKIPTLSIYAYGDLGHFYVQKKKGEIVEELNLKLYLK